MAQLHMMTIETKALMTRPNKGSAYDEDWFEEIEQYNLSLRPSEFELVEQTDEKQVVKATMTVYTSITLSDDEYKAWKCVDWWEDLDHGDIEIKMLYNESFDVLDHDCEWVSDDELDY
jgi:hypothetical protein